MFKKLQEKLESLKFKVYYLTHKKECDYIIGEIRRIMAEEV